MPPPPYSRSTMSYTYSWVADAINELATLTFYVIVGVQFRPQKENPYLSLRDEDEDLEIELEMEALRQSKD